MEEVGPETPTAVAGWLAWFWVVQVHPGVEVWMDGWMGGYGGRERESPLGGRKTKAWTT
jgi:hypothetical protein